VVTLLRKKNELLALWPMKPIGSANETVFKDHASRTEKVGQAWLPLIA
jgi:hypothetical protein